MADERNDGLFRYFRLQPGGPPAVPPTPLPLASAEDAPSSHEKAEVVPADRGILRFMQRRVEGEVQEPAGKQGHPADESAAAQEQCEALGKEELSQTQASASIPGPTQLWGPSPASPAASPGPPAEERIASQAVEVALQNRRLPPTPEALKLPQSFWERRAARKARRGRSRSRSRSSSMPGPTQMWGSAESMTQEADDVQEEAVEARAAAGPEIEALSPTLSWHPILQDNGSDQKHLEKGDTAKQDILSPTLSFYAVVDGKPLSKDTELVVSPTLSFHAIVT